MTYRTAPDRRAALLAAAEESARAVDVARAATESAEGRVVELEREIHGHRVTIGKAAEQQRELEARAKAGGGPGDEATLGALAQERTGAEAALAACAEALAEGRKALADARRTLAAAEHTAALAARDLATSAQTKDEG